MSSAMASISARFFLIRLQCSGFSSESLSVVQAGGRFNECFAYRH